MNEKQATEQDRWITRVTKDAESEATQAARQGLPRPSGTRMSEWAYAQAQVLFNRLAQGGHTDVLEKLQTRLDVEIRQSEEPSLEIKAVHRAEPTGPTVYVDYDGQPFKPNPEWSRHWSDFFPGPERTETA